jgi:hypothetical protein
VDPVIYYFSSEGSTNLLGVTVPNHLGYETFAVVGTLLGTLY